MSKPRRAFNKTERLAAALLEIKRGDCWLIPEPLRSQGTAAEICKQVEADHGVPWALSQDNSPQNLVHRSKAEHLTKTRKDIPAIAKFKDSVKRREVLTPEQLELRRVLLKIEGREYLADRPKKKSRFDSAPMPGSKASPWAKRYDRKTKRWITVRREEEKS